MFARPTPQALLIGLVCAMALSGCVTPRVKPVTSAAVVEARAKVGQKPSACPAGELKEVSPTLASFGFDEATLSEVGHERLGQAAAWLICHPGVEVAVLTRGEERGHPDRDKELAGLRGQAVVTELRALGAQSVVHILPPGAADPLQGPHLVIQAAGRGW